MSRGNFQLDDRFGAFDAALRKATDDGLAAAALVGADAAVSVLGRNHGGVHSEPGEPPNSQTGTLSRSIHYVHPRNLAPGVAAFGTNVEYGRHLEFGATVRPKNVKALPVPLTREAARLQRRVTSIRQLGLKFAYRPSTKPNCAGILGTESGKGKVFKPMFALMRVVHIWPRPWLKRSMLASRSASQATFNRVVTQQMRAHLGGPNGK